MIETPVIGGSITVVEGLFAIALFVTGYIIHETMHVIPLEIWGHEYEVEILPREDGQSWLKSLFVGTVVQITVEKTIPRRHVVISSLAPGLVSIIPLMGLAWAFRYPVVDVGTLVVLGLWFMVSIPSLRDWATVLTYEQTKTVETAEVS